ncbi:P-type conjugative transfer protein TrbJ [Thiomonas arsenitoxydans]|jgi:P-type conjugative transfer protein TrbJ|uniref:P-type conjugative transfer protein TrbJ n=1 Tax=Thiomonas arsenitoxydans (strain DSM 22701 / CIP 110005 / 3As) TaxID=426114 RepID=A0ABP1YZA2_THIA3|nr:MULTISPECIES: P-type conjugative transfer protein TrbJ [Thiomonas]MDE1978277.1 P-type conjugative transfer protein TrbJ [Betaproteobacteria bacterium]CQR44198.1 P-type conjugative transfer protein TrbJ [Thiomonas sp. CB3]MDE2175505.1 P-type conjugative transfer protein TrbJ [Betaproteobacteria bacterium]OZB70556.1 MAG: P-type conjugative transfer protein TrbJ [Thiomonas sp. 13-64-67]CDW95858.1 P-type conjugative transfer protein TrbJ [Thiomonas sp. CB2]
MTLKKSIVALGAIAALASTPAHATGMIAGATFPEQIVQELTAVEQYATQAQQLQAQFQMVYNQAMNLKNLPDQIWPNIAGQLQSLVTLVGQAQGLTYASQNTAAGVQAQYGVNGQSYQANLSQWNGNLTSQIQQALNSYGLQAQDFQTQQQALQQIQNASQSATGRMQVLQAGNQISGMLVNQLQGLQQTIMTNSQVELNAVGAKNAQDLQKNQINQSFLNGSTGAGFY